jgi:hypothetical protein
MTPKDLNYAIAQKIEPFGSWLISDPSIVSYTTLHERGLRIDASEHVGNAWVTPKRCWRYWRHGWEPRDFTKDPEMSILLLKTMAAGGMEPLIDYEVGCWAGMVLKPNTREFIELYQTPYKDEPGPVIAELFARAQGIWIE